MKKLIALAVALTFLGAACPTKPTAYATELDYCLHSSESWDEYEPCCVDVARRYGRDPSFCMRGADGLNDAGSR